MVPTIFLSLVGDGTVNLTGGKPQKASSPAFFPPRFLIDLYVLLPLRPPPSPLPNKISLALSLSNVFLYIRHGCHAARTSPFREEFVSPCEKRERVSFQFSAHQGYNTRISFIEFKSNVRGSNYVLSRQEESNRRLYKPFYDTRERCDCSDGECYILARCAHSDARSDTSSIRFYGQRAAGRRKSALSRGNHEVGFVRAIASRVRPSAETKIRDWSGAAQAGETDIASGGPGPGVTHGSPSAGNKNAARRKAGAEEREERGIQWKRNGREWMMRGRTWTVASAAGRKEKRAKRGEKDRRAPRRCYNWQRRCYQPPRCNLIRALSHERTERRTPS